MKIDVKMMKTNRLAIAGSMIFFVINLLNLVVFFDGRHGGFNLFAYLLAQELWPFKVGIVFQLTFLLIESFIVFLILNSIKRIWIGILLIIILCFLSWPILDFSGL